MKKPNYIIVLFGVVLLLAFDDLRRRAKPHHHRYIDGILSIVGSVGLLWWLFTKFPEPVLPSAVILRFLPIVGGILLLFIAQQPKYYGGKEEYLVQAITKATLTAGLFFARPIWMQWGIAVARSIVFYAAHRTLGIHNYSNNRTFQMSIHLAARLFGVERRPDGKYDDPRFQTILDELETESQQTEQNED
jgi:hypothetical protein